MDRSFDFDALAKAVAGGFSRREALRRLGVGLAAGLLAELTGWLPAWPTARAEAATVAVPVSLCFPEIVTKGSLQSWLCFSCSLEQGTCCNNVCVFVQTDPNNCGACGHACAAGFTCSGGKCIPRCNPLVCSAFSGGVCCGGQCCASNACCNNVCVGLESDPKNCGACGRACGTGESCSNGICVCGSSGQSCSHGQGCCSGVCINLASDPNNCGACGHRCLPSHACCGGVCCPLPAQSCCGGACCGGLLSSFACCSNVCVNTRSDSTNCGSCGHACPIAPAPFPPRIAPCCNGVCCGPSQSCQNGVCV